MSKADKMFEELKYSKEETMEYIIYRREEILGINFKNIIFDTENNLINIRTDDIKNYQTITTILNMQELQAVNEKCKELGWLK